MGTGLSLFAYPDSRVVQTVYGQVVGRRMFDNGERQVDAFQGIPFAKPPVGELRFRKPRPPDPWSGVRQCKAFGPRAMQKDFFFFIPYQKGHLSEDCLYLNVFTPAWEPPPRGFPVMVFIHGGGFSMETAVSYGDVGICNTLCTKDVVVVTIQYRLGYLGFFHTGDEACPSNLGLWDQTEALKWVRMNIGAFGGNSNNVTVLGQSAGAASADMLHLSPHSNNLFHKVVSMAGTACAPWAFHHDLKTQCERKAMKLGMTWDSTHELIEKLRTVPAADLAVNMVARNHQRGGAYLETTPVIDGDFFPKVSLEEMRRAAPPIPTMTGVCKIEALLFMMFRKATAKDFAKYTKILVPDGVANAETARDELQAEYVDDDSERTPTETLRIVMEMFSDFFMNYPTLKMAKDSARIQGDSAPVYMYQFDYHNPKSWGWLRYFMPMTESTHCTELAYVFNKGYLFGFSFNDDDERMLQMFSTALVNFAKTGNPNSAPDADEALIKEWKPLNDEHPERHMKFDLNPHQSDSFYGGRPAKVIAYQEEARRDSHL